MEDDDRSHNPQQFGNKTSSKYDYESDSEESTESDFTHTHKKIVMRVGLDESLHRNINSGGTSSQNHYQDMLFHQQKNPRSTFVGSFRPLFHHPYAPYSNMQNVQYHSSNTDVYQPQPFVQIPGYSYIAQPQYQQNVTLPSHPHGVQPSNFINAPNKLQGSAPYGIHHLKIKKICDALDEKKILSGSAELLNVVQDETFYNRLNNLWEEFDIDKRINFLRIISETLAISSNQFRHSIHEFLNKILMSTLIEKIVDQILQIPYNPAMQIPLYGKLIQYMAEIMLAGFELIPSHKLSKVENLISIAEKTTFLPPETKELIEKLKKVYEDVQKRNAQPAQNVKNAEKVKYRPFEGSLGEPPTDFRQLSIIPTPADLNPNYRPYLRVAKFKGRYECDEHYLDVQFRLLREDLIHPLRMGISDYKAGNHDIFIYKNVVFDEPSLHLQSGNFIHYANMRITRQIRYGKAMKYNSLLCISPDNFKEVFLFAIVQDSNAECLKKGKIGIKFENDDEIDISLSYNIVESPAFFEAYRYVMATLQHNKLGNELPFSKYFVKVETEISAPKYLLINSTSEDILYQSNFDFSCILTDIAKQKYSTTLFSSHFLEKMDPMDFGMNKSQFDAFTHALKSELAVIQGPPGTGKSYLGLQIAKLLLDAKNWSTWNPKNDERPLLVVCYTNHALDQFLEGIHSFMNDGIVRVGGRSKNEILKNFMLFKLRPIEASKASKIGYSVLRGKVEDIFLEILECQNVLKQCEIRLISNKMMKSVEKYKLPSLTNEDFIRWLTFCDENRSQITFDVNYIRYLVKWGVDEETAKSAYVYACENKINVDAAEMFRKLNTNAFKDIPSYTENPYTKNWPSLDDFDEVVGMGYPEVIALAVLESSDYNMDNIREEQRFFKQIEQPDLILEQNAVDTMKIDDVEVDDEEEDDEEEDDEESLDIINKEKKAKIKQFKEWAPPKEMEMFLPYIKAAIPMSEEEQHEIFDSIWDLPLQTRWRLYQAWISKIQDLTKKELKKLEVQYSEKKKLLIEKNTVVDSDILKKAKVVGMTTTGAAKYQSTLLSIRPRVVIVEEAAEVLEAHIITSLTEACEHLILIGDHQQLRPNTAVYKLARNYNLEISLFERLINNKFPYAKLDTQHRMRPEISRVLMPHFYQNLLDDVSVENLPNVKGMTKNFLFINHSFPETSQHIDGSHKNQYEVQYSIRLALYLLQQGYSPNQITILSTYLDQYLALKKNITFLLGEKHGVRIENVDNYQGEECDIIILSLVRSNNDEKKIGFLNIPNRVCVALSRAKQGLYVIGNFDFLAEHCELWANIKMSVEKVGALSHKINVKCQMHNTVQTIKHFNDFATKCKEGGCQIYCKTRLKCGHTCARLCHGSDINHEIDLCRKPCARLCPLNHPCNKFCNEECDPCKIMVKKLLPCGHEVATLCHTPFDEIHCEYPCNRNLKCGHKCQNRCGEKCIDYCPIKVTVMLPSCGHVVTTKCVDDPNTYKCPAPITKKWEICNHEVVTACHINPNGSPCPNPCNAKFEDCEHLCQGTCGTCDRGRLHIPCKKTCNRQLICGHKCYGKCGEVCEPCQKSCQTACEHSKCGSIAVKQMKIRWMQNENTAKNVGRLCYEACPPCMEKCQNQCQHQKCQMKCSQKCNIELCLKPCRKMLECGLTAPKGKQPKSQEHFCIGVCHGNEKCLQICKICTPKKYDEIKKPFFGNEQNEDAFFVMLDNCEHIFEATGLDSYIQKSLNLVDTKTGDRETKKLKCPKCEGLILTSRRYHSFINQQAEDIEIIKQIICNFNQDEKKQEQFYNEVDEIIEDLENVSLFDKKNLAVLERALHKSPHLITPNWIKAVEKCQKILSTLILPGETSEKIKNIEITKELAEALDKPFVGGMDAYLKNKLNTFIVACANIPNSNTIFQQLVQEIARFELLVLIIEPFKGHLATLLLESEEKEAEFIQPFLEILNKIVNENLFSREFEKHILEELLSAYDMKIAPGEFEIEKYSTSNRWYKKDNGEFYSK